MSRSLPLFLLAMGCAVVARATEPPLRWIAPAQFDPKKPGLGLPQIPGVTHEILYAPAPSFAAIEKGGSGRYESVLHGTYNHHTRALVAGDKVVVYWTNHSDDENGPGQRILARWGLLDAQREHIDWGDPAQRTLELAPAPVLVHRRVPLEAAGFDRRYVRGALEVVDGGLRFSGSFMLNVGWTDDPRFRMRSTEPVPAERFRLVPDGDAKNRYGRVYRYDMFWTLGPSFCQLWRFSGDRLVPASDLYLEALAPTSLMLTASTRLELPKLLPPFDGAALISAAPPSQRHAFETATPKQDDHPHYARGTEPLAADGRNALAHRAEFRRRDGTWVIIRDNLANPGFYYAAAAQAGAANPPGIPTNLYGDAMPAAGELPDGRVWILGNSRGRYDFFLTISDDGITFDRTWLVRHINGRWVDGFAKPARGGPQYPYVVPIGDALWIFYSIGKEQIGATRVPLASLHRDARLPTATR